MRIDGINLFTEDVEFSPAVYFDDTPVEEREEMVPELPYDTTDPKEDELKLPNDFYIGLRYKLVEIYKQRQTIKRFLDADKVQASIPANLAELEQQVAAELADEEDDAAAEAM